MSLKTPVDILGRLSQIFPQDRLEVDATRLSVLVENATSVSHEVLACVRVNNLIEIREVLKIASDTKTAVYPFSRGCNWGYGSRSPYKRGAILLDLSLMNKIRAFDVNTGVVTVEPGVTPQQLHLFLKDRNAPYLVPTTGAGGEGSLLGNALERGFGLTPETDHFQAVMSLGAVLPSGELYRSGFATKNADRLNAHFKWGIGPYLDGLFGQSNFGVVTEMSIALKKMPSHISGLYFSLKSDADFEPVCRIVQEIMHRYNGQMSGINLMNSLRVIAMTRKSPSQTALSVNEVRALASEAGISEWTGAGALYVDSIFARSVERQIRKLLVPHCSRVVFIDSKRLSLLRGLAKFIPRSWVGGYSKQFDKIDESLQIFMGKPSRAALPLVYWRSREPIPEDPTAFIRPDGQDLGLLWYAPVSVLDPIEARKLNEMVNRVCREHDIDPLVTFTAFSPRVFDVTIPIVFNRADAVQAANAKRCYDRLVKEGQALGCLPYRLGVYGSDTMIERDDFWSLQSKIKQMLDPDNILSPGRYSLEVK